MRYVESNLLLKLERPGDETAPQYGSFKSERPPVAATVCDVHVWSLERLVQSVKSWLTILSARSSEQLLFCLLLS